MKIPVSVLVVVYTPDGQVLLLERADHPGFWQSVTGSRDFADEPLMQTCRREVFEETGIDAAVEDFNDWQQTNQYRILAQWRKRFAPGVMNNTEHLFSLQVPEPVAVALAPREHLSYQWLPWRAAADRCFSWTNAAAIRALAERGLVPVARAV